jgi:hypothetical protein
LVHAEARRRGGIEVVNHALKSLLERACAEVDEHAHGKFHEPKVFEEEKPRSLFGVIEFAGAAGILPEDVVDERLVRT